MFHSSATSRPQCMSELTSEDFYYDAASSLSEQKTRMSNKDRMESFSRAIYRNKHLFKGKVVLEVGCGLGLLSLFAAKAGAKRVLAIELPGLAEQTEKVVRSNTSRIEVLQGTVTDVTLPVTSVDIIISDWMGPCLLHESILQAVIQARDLWLVPGGLLLPDRATLYLTTTSERLVERSQWWDNVYGWNMSTIGRAVLDDAVIQRVRNDSLATNSCLVAEFCLQTCRVDDIYLPRPWSLQARGDDDIGGLVLYWKVHFSYGESGPSSYSTEPEPNCSVHGVRKKQVVLGLQSPLMARKGEEILGCIQLVPNWETYRSQLTVRVCLSFVGAICNSRESRQFRII